MGSFANATTREFGYGAGAKKGVVCAQGYFSLATDQVSNSFFICDQAYQLMLVQVTWTTASTSGTLMLQRCQGTEAVGSGDDLLSGTVDLSGTADTVTEPTIVTTNNVHRFAENDRIGAEFGGVVTNGVGVCVCCWLLPLKDRRYERT